MGKGLANATLVGVGHREAEECHGGIGDQGGEQGKAGIEQDAILAEGQPASRGGQRGDRQ
ncbi:hypothetical protein D3C85_1904310 [compost metagenome]